MYDAFKILGERSLPQELASESSHSADSVLGYIAQLERVPTAELSSEARRRLTLLYIEASGL